MILRVELPPEARLHEVKGLGLTPRFLAAASYGGQIALWVEKNSGARTQLIAVVQTGQEQPKVGRYIASVDDLHLYHVGSK